MQHEEQDRPETFDMDHLANVHQEEANKTHSRVMSQAEDLKRELVENAPEDQERDAFFEFLDEHNVYEHVEEGMANMVFLISVMLDAHMEGQSIVIGDDNAVEREIQNAEHAMKVFTNMLALVRVNEEMMP